MEQRSAIELSRYKAKLELHSIKNLEARLSFFLDIRNSTRKIVELLELDLIKLESIKKIINTYTQTRLESKLTRDRPD